MRRPTRPPAPMTASFGFICVHSLDECSVRGIYQDRGCLQGSKFGCKSTKKLLPGGKLMDNIGFLITYRFWSPLLALAYEGCGMVLIGCVDSAAGLE